MIARLLGSALALLAAGSFVAGAEAAAQATQQAAAQASVWDQLKAGEAAAAGTGVPKDVAKARRIFEKIMQSADPKAAAAAAIALAKLAQDQLNDPALAAQALERGIALGDPWSMMLRAQVLEKGDPKDQKRAIDLLQRAVASSDPDVQKEGYYELGQLYLSSSLLSAKLALQYHQQAADLGNMWSLFAIGGIYDKGSGTAPDWNKAQEYYQKAIDEGTPDVKGAAAYAMAQLYQQPKHNDPKRAVYYLKLGQQAGNVWSSLQLADFYLKGLGVKKSTATGLGLYNDLRSGPDPAAAKAAAFQLGRYYSEGGRPNLPLAEENFTFGADRGDPWAAFFLAQLYIKQMPSKAHRRKARDILNALGKSDDPQLRSAAAKLAGSLR